MKTVLMKLSSWLRSLRDATKCSTSSLGSCGASALPTTAPGPRHRRPGLVELYANLVELDGAPSARSGRDRRIHRLEGFVTAAQVILGLEQGDADHFALLRSVQQQETRGRNSLRWSRGRARLDVVDQLPDLLGMRALEGRHSCMHWISCHSGIACPNVRAPAGPRIGVETLIFQPPGASAAA